MPTGYTEKIKNGITFEKFALDCARAFGAFAMMRDESLNAEIPEKFEPNEWHKKQLEEARAKYQAALKWTNEEAQQQMDCEYQKKLDSWQAWEKKTAELKEKYNQMLAKVEDWDPPTPGHFGLKNFMIEQIKRSIAWDCAPMDKPVKQTSAEWLVNFGKECGWDMAYHQKEYQKEVENTNERNEWLRQLRESLFQFQCEHDWEKKPGQCPDSEVWTCRKCSKRLEVTNISLGDWLP